MIVDIFSHEGKVVFVCKILRSIKFDSHFQSFVVAVLPAGQVGAATCRDRLCGDLVSLFLVFLSFLSTVDGCVQPVSQKVKYNLSYSSYVKCSLSLWRLIRHT